MSLNSFFTESELEQTELKEQSVSTTRKPRSDKRHNIKFPVTPAEHQLLKMTFKQTCELYNKELTQTAFNTHLLKFALYHLDIVDWNKPYKDSKRYMHTQLLETDYREIGGPYGISTQKQTSDRKVVYYLVISALHWLRRENNHDKIF